MPEAGATAPAAMGTGATVHAIAPSGPFEAKAFEKGLSWLQQRGYAVQVRGDLLERAQAESASELRPFPSYLAGTDSQRLQELQEALDDEEAAAIWMVRGGYGSTRLLGDIDWSQFRKHPKWLIGFSDITALLLSAYQATGRITLHAPMIGSIGRGLFDKASEKALVDLLTSERLYRVELEGAKVLHGGHAEGVLYGGNLSLLSSLVGTEHLNFPKGTLLFLEDVDERPYRIDRMLTQLGMSGNLDRVNGVIVGSLGIKATEQERLLQEFFALRKIPIMTNVGIGHESTNLAMPIGASAVMDTDAHTLECTLR